MSANFRKQLLKKIPGGSHTYSRGFDQFSSNAPQILERGKGCFIYDNYGNKFIDYGMGLRSSILGYANKKVDQSAINGIKKGNNLTLPTITELEAANKILNNIKSADMVKFAKTGSAAVTAAIKISRAYNNRDIILKCKNDPFYSYDDWFIADTKMKLGVPKVFSKLVINFNYNNVEELKKIIKKKRNKISCLIMEAANICHPVILNKKDEIIESMKFNNYIEEKKYYSKNYHFLKFVQKICRENNIIFIIDEMITGMRWSIGGAQEFYNISPDISTFGKAIANGYSVSAVVGKRKYMKLGSIEDKGKKRLFLLSSTHGAEMNSLSAMTCTLEEVKKNKVINKIWQFGYKLKNGFNKIAIENQIEKYLFMDGIACSPYYVTKDINLKNCFKMRTTFQYLMTKHKIFMPWISLTGSHNEKILNQTLNVLKKIMPYYKKALKTGANKYVRRNLIKPVFREFN